MSKFNSKNLSYASKPPPFLAALQAQAAGHTGPDPITSARRRPAGKKRSASEEAEDVPLVVDEQGNAVALTVDKDGVVAAGQHDDPRDDDAAVGEDPDREEGKKEKKDADADAKATIGGRRRKVGKVVGGDVDADGEKDAAVDDKLVLDEHRRKDKDAKSRDKKEKKKAKKIKLSFDED